MSPVLSKRAGQVQSYIPGSDQQAAPSFELEEDGQQAHEFTLILQRREVHGWSVAAYAPREEKSSCRPPEKPRLSSFCASIGNIVKLYLWNRIRKSGS